MYAGFCMIISKSRLCQGVAAYKSLERTAGEFKMFFLCMDYEAFAVLRNLELKKAVVFHISEIENAELLRLKSERSFDEYCWTLKPTFLLHVLERFDYIERITHIDADLFFFANPMSIFANDPDTSVLLTTHQHLVNDDCNSGFVSFKRDAKGLLCIDWWKKQCLDWCYFRKEENRFGDQKYLDTMLAAFEGVRITRLPGVNIAPWNSFRFIFTKRGSEVYVNDSPLIFYHFCGFRIINANEYVLVYSSENIPSVYEPYTSEIKSIIRQVENISPGLCACMGEDIQWDSVRERRPFI